MGPPPSTVVSEGRDTRGEMGRQGPGGLNKGSEWQSQYNEKHKKHESPIGAQCGL